MPLLTDLFFGKCHVAHRSRRKGTAIIKRILIANRGEIAVRVARSAQELGIETVAVYNHADADSMHRFCCDFAVHLQGASLAETYLHHTLLVEVAKRSGCDAVHPGYGFLSENGDFVQAVEDAGLIFIGPSAEVVRLLGDKLRAKQALAAHGIPTVPGTAQALQQVEEIDVPPDAYPILLKAALGGGGKGIRAVNGADELPAAFAACQRAAQNYFGDNTLLWEKKLPRPRHIEVQILADHHGNVVHLYERDCSLQRRYQKILEEAPSCYLNTAQRTKLGTLAVQAARAVNYRGVGTVEFICASPDECYFMEVNTRIQVEHPVSEMVTGIDLIKEQIAVAAGEKLTLAQEDITLHGHAIEVRINCEDAQRNFLPCPGRITELAWPAGAFVRVDSHIYRGYRVPAEFDSLLAKIICQGRDRDEAIARACRALQELHIEGVPTTAAYHRLLLEQEEFRQGNFDTTFLDTMATRNFSHDQHAALLAVLVNGGAA